MDGRAGGESCHPSVFQNAVEWVILHITTNQRTSLVSAKENKKRWRPLQNRKPNTARLQATKLDELTLC
jgi:hypothetical protein